MQKSRKKAAEKLPKLNAGHPDYILIAVVCAIALFGAMMVYSASSYSAQSTYGDRYFFLKKQLIGFLLGAIAMAGITFFDYRRLNKLKYPILIISVLLLIAVFIPGISESKYGARRWIRLPGFTMQASEIAKFGFIIFTASYMAKNHARMNTFFGMLPVLGVGALMALLIILEPNMSITICVVLLMLVMLFMGGAKLKYFAMLAIPIAALVPILIIIEPYRMNRLVAFLNPWASPQGEGFQLIQSFYSLGSGGWFGLGLFQSRQKFLFLPFSESDFIFSIIGEELGLVGCLCVMLAFVFLIYRIVKISLKAPDRFGCFLAAGIAAIIGIQTIVNLAVVTGSIPPTGLPLPFISSGSTSLVVFMASIGIVLNISRYSDKNKAQIFGRQKLLNEPKP